MGDRYTFFARPVVTYIGAPSSGEIAGGIPTQPIVDGTDRTSELGGLILPIGFGAHRSMFEDAVTTRERPRLFGRSRVVGPRVQAAARERYAPWRLDGQAAGCQRSRAGRRLQAVRVSASAYVSHGAPPVGTKILSEYGGTPTSGLVQISFYY